MQEDRVDPIIIEALLVTGGCERVRVILGSYYLDVEADDVLDLEEMPLPDGVVPGSAIAARVTLKPGARLQGVGSATAYRDALYRGLPFALTTRPTVVFAADSMKVREDAFFAARGLKERFA
jgi:hypothetical protein